MATLIEQLRSGDVVLARVYDELTKARDVVFSFAPGDLHEMINGARHGLGALPRFSEAAVRIDDLEVALKRALGMLEHATVSTDWTEEEAAQARDVWDEDMENMRSILAAK